MNEFVERLFNIKESLQIFMFIVVCLKTILSYLLAVFFDFRGMMYRIIVAGNKESDKNGNKRICTMTMPLLKCANIAKNNPVTFFYSQN